ncbi:MAG: ribonucleoside-diphosphate reductase, adenosylcobalamin-dependent, partial [Anaerolineaceae bacterium]|nr:ribonucleoside-diphosphate reductase, adenosylcobalamin-dependent [Anaerolineaceae bacterium]
EAGIPIKTHKRIRARELFDKIVSQSHHNGEPGVLFLDTANRDNPVPHLYKLESTNPCGEQWLGPYENCCLGSINLAQHLGPDGTIDWEELEKSIHLAVNFLDNVVNANHYVPSVPKLKEAAHNARRIGLGIMGLADVMYHVGARYGSRKGQEFAAQMMEFVRYHAMLRSIKLSKERGAFPVIKGSIYDPENVQWQIPQSVVNYEHNWERPIIDWQNVLSGIKQYGIRNAAQTTIAPTGTIATVAGCEGYGCEPTFALTYIRHVNDDGKDLKLTYTSPSFEKALIQAGLSPDLREKIFENLLKKGSIQQIDEVPEYLRDVFVVSQDIKSEEHVYMQAALQAFVDNSLSKTVNFPVGTEKEDIAKTYELAWKLGCKGITVYVTGSRDVVVLETQATAAKKTVSGKEIKETETVWKETVKKKPRPRALPGYTYSNETPLGKAFVTINENGESQPFEVFINTAKAGSDVAAVSEAIGRLISYILRISSPILPVDRMRDIIRQMEQIGGGRPLGFGPKRVRSLPDGISQVLDEYLEEKLSRDSRVIKEKKPNGQSQVAAKHPRINGETNNNASKIGDLCPDCGQAAFVNEEGCRKCYACGYSEC